MIHDGQEIFGLNETLKILNFFFSIPFVRGLRCFHLGSRVALLNREDTNWMQISCAFLSGKYTKLTVTCLCFSFDFFCSCISVRFRMALKFVIEAKKKNLSFGASAMLLMFYFILFCHIVLHMLSTYASLGKRVAGNRGGYFMDNMT